MKKFFIQIYGCLYNYADAQLIRNLLKRNGYVETDDYRQADLFIIVSCSVRQKAEDKAMAWKNKLKQLPKKPIVVLTGCMVRRDHFGTNIEENLKYLKKIYHANSWIDVFIDISNIDSLPKLLNGPFPVFQIDNKQVNYLENYFPVDTSSPSVFGFIPIMNGCNEFCSYCIVPYTRGQEYFFKYDIILDNVKKSLDKGKKIIVLLGQIVDKWVDLDKNKRFVNLLQDISELKYDFWFYFTSPHPKYITKDIIDVISESDRLMDFLGLPLQSGSNRVLKAMNRKYTVEDYLEVVNYAKSRINDVYLTTDVIVGYPPENEQDFQQTIELLRTVRFDKVYFAKYSPRLQIHRKLVQSKEYQEVLSYRFNVMREILDKIFYEKNVQRIGKIERAMYVGNRKFVSFRNQLIDLLPRNGLDLKKGEFYNVKIVGGGRKGIVGKPYLNTYNV